MRIAALVKQVPGSGTTPLEMDALSRRAIAQAVELAAAVGDGECTAITLGASSAEDVLRESIAWGSSCGVMTDGVLVVDPAFAEHTTLDVSRALVEAIEREGPYDLLVVGDRASDGGAGRTGPQVAELLDLPFLGPARFLSMQSDVLHVRCERDSGFLQATVSLPAVISCAPDLIPPCEVPESVRATVRADRVRVRDADQLESASRPVTNELPSDDSAVIGVVAEPGDAGVTRQLIAFGTARAEQTGAPIVALGAAPDAVGEDVAHAVAEWARQEGASALIASSSPFGREIAGRVAVLVGERVQVVSAPEHVEATPSAADPGMPVHALGLRPRGRVRVVSRPA